METRRFLNPLTAKVLSIGLVVLLLMIPIARVKSLVAERAGMRQEAVARVAAGWGGNQVIGAPLLAIPVDWAVPEGDRIVRSRHIEHVLPSEAVVQAALRPELRNVGIYTVPVYVASVQMSGSFPARSLRHLVTDQPGRTVRWADARLLLPLSDVRGIREFRRAQWNEEALDLKPGAYDSLAAVSAALPVEGLRQGQNAQFRFELELAGSENLRVLPLAQATTVRLQSSWPHPNFSSGAFLPVERSVDSSGFDARWQVLELNRGFPQQWTDAEVGAQRLLASAFGVDLFQPVDTYQRNERAIKYAVLFIAITLMTIFLWEHAAGLRLHSMQYLLVGLALAVFYLLLLALSEHLRFGSAYLAAAAALVALIGIYMAGALHRTRVGVISAVTLSAVYSTLYLLILSEQYALLLGAAFVFTVLATIMIVTRRFDWNAIGERPRSQAGQP